MRTTGAITLDIEPGSVARPATVPAVLTGAPRTPKGQVQLTPTCSSLDEFEACINVLQDELDALRDHARRVFRPSGYA